MAEDDSAERAEDESDTEGRKRRERARPVAVTVEEDLTEDQCCDDSVEKEVVPFDDGTDERSGCRAAGARGQEARGCGSSSMATLPEPSKVSRQVSAR